MSAYLAVPALPAEQQDSNANPSGDPLGWVVVRVSDEEVVAGHTMYLDHAEAERIAARMSTQARLAADRHPFGKRSDAS